MQRQPINKSHSRRGSLYISVMVVSVIVSLVAVSSLHIARLSLDISQASDDQVIAEQMARSAVEFAVNRINSDGSWRTTYTNDTETPVGGYTIGDGNFTFKLVDPDGDLSDDDADGVWLSGIGQAGDARFVETVFLQPTGQPLSCLEPAFHCGGNITASSTVNLTTNQDISSNGNITATATGSSVEGDAEAVGTIDGNITGSSTTITARRMPSDTAFEYYLANGTWIDASVLPSGVLGTKALEEVVLSPSSNPFGTQTNAEGIYVIDCAGFGLSVCNLRICGTVVIVNPESVCGLARSIYGKAFVPNYPVLMVQGDFLCQMTTSPLEESTVAVNFNPVGSPYEGSEDSDMVDVYPSRIEGLVYVSGEFNFVADAQDSDFDGCVICGSSRMNSDAEFLYRSTFYDYPPPGFASGNPMRIAPGTWHRTSIP